jgi:protein-S-isoprenylcysteine O-methyltransferase Ste14
MRSFRWSNIPIPEGHLIPLIAGLVLHIFSPQPLSNSLRLKNYCGWPLLLLGSLLAGWAVASVKDIEISTPSRIVVSGPYRFSRNPMYVAWTLIYAGAAFIVNTWWLIIFMPLTMIFTHQFVVLREEQQLERLFGDEFRKYCDKVRRYL